MFFAHTHKRLLLPSSCKSYCHCLARARTSGSVELGIGNGKPFINKISFSNKFNVSLVPKPNWERSLSKRNYASAFGIGNGESTIYALATGGLRSAVAIIRISGPSSAKVLQEIGCFPPGRFPAPRVATVKSLYDVSDGSLLDHAMVLWFPGPNSYTGEDCCEFHVHGGVAVINGLLQSINSFQDCRMAEPGEFTRRSFLNGKMDLTEVDGLADLISAETEMQRIQALNQMTGDLAQLYESWRDRIAKSLANVEAFIDFGEDENIEADILETVDEEVSSLLEEMQVHLEDARRGERLRNGVLVAILGRPNVGKSSLLNLLCKRETAIVSDIPGTTRDVLQATINVNGYPVLLADTAGIRDTPGDVIETEGIRRALNEAKKADILVLVVDSNDKRFTARAGDIEVWDREKLIHEEILQQLYKGEEEDVKSGGETPLDFENILIVGNKLDLWRQSTEIVNQNRSMDTEEEDEKHSRFILDCSISCKTLEGYEDFWNQLGSKVSNLCANPKSEAAHITQERYRSHIQNCVAHLNEYLQFSKLANTYQSQRQGQKSSTSGTLGTASNGREVKEVDFALGTVPLKSAMNSIGCITGHFGTEDILDIIFRDFCIGK